jgi:hypothetical protein
LFQINADEDSNFIENLQRFDWLMINDVSEEHPALSSRPAEKIILFLTTSMTDVESSSETLLLGWLTQNLPPPPK